MTRLARRSFLVCCLVFFSGSLFAQEDIRFGIATVRPKAHALTQWAPLGVALNKAFPEYSISIEVFTPAEIQAAVSARQIDFVLASPSSYLLMANRSGLSAPLVTLSNIEQVRPINEFGGVIFTRADTTNIQTLADVAGQTTAISTKGSFAGFEVQAYELSRLGINPDKDMQLVTVGMPQDKVVESVLSGKATVGFVRTGLLESMAGEGALDLSKINVLNRQQLTGYPFAVSTPLYPEWPLSAMPHTSKDVQRKIVSFLLTLHENKKLTDLLGIHGFDVPADYSSVAKLLRDLRLPPFDIAPTFTVSDVMARYRWPIAIGLIALSMIVLLGFFLLWANRRLASEKMLVQTQASKLNERKKQYQQLAEDMPLFLVTFTPDGKLTYLNDALLKFLAMPASQVVGKNFFDLICDQQCEPLKERLNLLTPVDSLASHQQHYGIPEAAAIDHQWIIRGLFDDAGNLSSFQAVGEDVSERKLAEQEIRNLAFYDTLTKLPNRRLLMDRLLLALTGSARTAQYGAVLFLDMDRFKTLNDTLGHDCGDLLLIEVAARIQGCVRSIDTVARLGGDEFVVLLEEVDESPREASQKVAHIAEKIRAALAVPYQLKGNEQHSSPSIGVSLFLGVEQAVDVILKQADMAMYQAKDSGRNAVRFFDPIMQMEVENRAALEADLRHAISDQQLYLYYQIQVDGERRPLGAEALLRWIHPVRGMVSPVEFIPIAEESALILEIGGWVLDNACQQLQLWSHSEAARELTLAVNVSAQQFKQHDFVERVSAAIRFYQIPASRLKLELTESVVLNDVVDVVTKMHALKALGVSLSMDDFGTGYSSLSYLKQLPLDQIKIDQSFVRDIATDPNDAVMVQTMIDLAQNFRLNVIAEGVETEAQLDFLKANGCMAYQGYFFSKPLPIKQFEALL
ncbi:MAG: EAL domain-containing protein [Gallionellaceae bacterium]